MSTTHVCIIFFKCFHGVEDYWLIIFCCCSFVDCLGKNLLSVQFFFCGWILKVGFLFCACPSCFGAAAFWCVWALVCFFRFSASSGDCFLHGSVLMLLLLVLAWLFIFLSGLHNRDVWAKARAAPQEEGVCHLVCCRGNIFGVKSRASFSVGVSKNATNIAQKQTCGAPK